MSKREHSLPTAILPDVSDHLTDVFRCAKNLSKLSNRTQSACQAKVYDLYVSWRGQAGQENILWLRES